MFTNDPHTGSYMKNSYENLLLSIKAMTYSKEGDDIECRQGGGTDEVAGTGAFANRLFRAT